MTLNATFRFKIYRAYSSFKLDFFEFLMYPHQRSRTYLIHLSNLERFIEDEKTKILVRKVKDSLTNVHAAFEDSFIKQDKMITEAFMIKDIEDHYNLLKKAVKTKVSFQHKKSFAFDYLLYDFAMDRIDSEMNQKRIKLNDLTMDKNKQEKIKTGIERQRRYRREIMRRENVKTKIAQEVLTEEFHEIEKNFEAKKSSRKKLYNRIMGLIQIGNKTDYIRNMGIQRKTIRRKNRISNIQKIKEGTKGTRKAQSAFHKMDANYLNNVREKRLNWKAKSFSRSIEKTPNRRPVVRKKESSEVEEEKLPKANTVMSLEDETAIKELRSVSLTFWECDNCENVFSSNEFPCERCKDLDANKLSEKRVKFDELASYIERQNETLQRLAELYNQSQSQVEELEEKDIRAKEEKESLELQLYEIGNKNIELNKQNNSKEKQVEKTKEEGLKLSAKLKDKQKLAAQSERIKNETLSKKTEITDNMKKKIDDIETEKKNTLKEVDKNASDLEEMLTMNESLKKEKDILVGELKIYTERLTKEIEEKDEMKKEIDEKLKGLEFLKKREEEAKQQLERAKKELSQMKSIDSKKDKEVINRKANLENLKSELKRENAKSEMSLSLVKCDLGKNLGEVEKLEKKMSISSKELKEVEAKLTIEKNDSEAAKKEIENNNEKIKKLESQHNYLVKHADIFKKTIETNKNPKRYIEAINNKGIIMKIHLLFSLIMIFGLLFTIFYYDEEETILEKLLLKMPVIRRPLNG